MATPSEFQPVDSPDKPSLADARLKAINQTVAPDTTVEPEHPAITYAKQLLSPMGPYGQANPYSGSEGAYPIGLAPSASVDEEAPAPVGHYTPPGVMPPGFNPYAAPADQRGAAQGTGFTYTPPTDQESGHLGLNIGGAPASENPAFRGIGDFLGNVGKGFSNLGNTELAGGVKVGDVGMMFAPASQEQSDSPLFALGPAGDFAGNIGEAAAPLLRIGANKLIGGAQDILRGKAPQFVTDAAGAGRADLGAGMPDRYVVEQGRTRSLIRDTQTGETTSTIYSGSDHAVKAQVAADALNSGAQAAKTMAAPEALMSDALNNLTKVKTTDGNLGRTVRIAIREQGLTPDTMLESPAMQGQIMQALKNVPGGASDENMASLAQQLFAQEKARPTAGNREAAAVRDAILGGAPSKELPPITFGEDIPKPINVPASAEQTAAEAGIQTPEQAALNTNLTDAIGRRENIVPPAPIGRNPAKALALGMLDLVTDIPRAAYLVGHLPLLRQGLPMMADAFVRGNPAEIPLAIGRTLRGYVISDARAAAVTDQFRGVLSDAGFGGDALRKLVSDIHGPMSAREDYTLNSFLANIPVLKQLNRAFPTMMNSLRVGMALDRVEMAKAAGQKVDFNLIADQVAHLSGKGDLPGTPGGRFQAVMARALFGPKLLTAPWQVAVDTIKSAGGIGTDLVARRPVKANDLAQIRSVVAYVATGATFMQLMQHAGWQVETNTDSRDWGRAIDPDTGERVDLWGAFGPDARLVMQVITRLNETQFGIGTPIRPQKYGQSDVVDMFEDYLRSKLGPGLAATTANVLTSKTGAGKPFSVRDEMNKAGQDPLGYIGENAPRPLGLEAFQGSNPKTAVRNALLTEAGAGVITTPHREVYDGLGTAEGQPNYRTGSILDTYAKMVEASKGSATPWHGGDPIMPAPPSTIGSGRSELKLDPKTASRFAQAVGDARDRALGPLVNSPEFQNASPTRQQQMFDEARTKADNTATRVFMRDQIITATDPKAIAAEAVTGFVAQGSSLHDRAYWIAVIDRAGKLTPEVARAIDTYELGLASAEKRAPITVEEYRRNAPLAHEYLGHVPYGTDAKPIGTPADWVAVAQAHDAKNKLAEDMTRAGMNPSLADAKAQAEILRAMTSLVQRNLFLNGAQLENPQRVLLARKYPLLKRFIGSAPNTIRESASDYQNFPQ